MYSLFPLDVHPGRGPNSEGTYNQFSLRPADGRAMVGQLREEK